MYNLNKQIFYRKSSYALLDIGFSKVNYPAKYDDTNPIKIYLKFLNKCNNLKQILQNQPANMNDIGCTQLRLSKLFSIISLNWRKMLVFIQLFFYSWKRRKRQID
ncbi:hypothetical protein TTHERM_01054160 (macronuclear) [Tetrahymena thermophila SB210]|uniref:Uncharacterized protein n=1 Tax=Tetrahymena thermophila (strain SB210) TaxID=312017 RepID=Q22CD5_TETTS|nr:hypothetical protein TTHERM_01054160 [Tetrahymena thermophila SB210]EAR82931.2 hypothetical protein TTHERM_01054160 [Tetrahymena thermophila SB210]|eukprot:XP_001030594.2 hypothetical protein TTHERM_01054160 [Tetrahymena thermophila SB210]